MPLKGIFTYQEFSNRTCAETPVLIIEIAFVTKDLEYPFKLFRIIGT